MRGSGGRAVALVRAAVLVACAVLAGCAGGPDPRDEAGRLAGDLADGVVDEATLSSGQETGDLLAALLGSLADVPRTVDVLDVREGETPGERVVDLRWTWDLGERAEPWVVETTALMERVEDRWVTRWSPTVVHDEATDTSSLRLVRDDARRGEVLGADGTPIVASRPVLRIGVDKANVPESTTPAAVAQDLAARLGFDDPAAFAQRVDAAGPSAFVVAITVRESEAQEWDVATLRTVPGVLVQAAELPLAPTSTFARPILGTVGEATAEIVEASDGEIRPGQQVGLSGLQRQYDETLRGVPATRVLLVVDGEATQVHESPAVDGQDLTVSLDVGLQTLAEDVLAEVEPAAAVVAVRPSDGHVLAAASGAGSAGLSTATVGLFPPGSTFKVATALALLRAGVAPDAVVECDPTLRVEGREFSNYPGYPATSLGRIPLREAVAQSCNTAFIAQRETVSSADLASAAASLGIGASGAWPFPYAAGSVPDDSTGTEHAANLIGQGKVLASPLAMAVAAASVASGSTVTPVVVVGGESLAEGPEQQLTQDEAAHLQAMMLEVVASGTSTFLQDVPGPPVGAKSGTAQFGTEDPPLTHAWMIAFQGDLAVAVFVGLGDYGTATAGPLLEEFLRGVPAAAGRGAGP